MDATRRRTAHGPRGSAGGGRGRVLDVEPSFGTFGGLFDAAGYAVWNAGASWRVDPAARAVRADREPVRPRRTKRCSASRRSAARVRWQGCGLLQAADVSFAYRIGRRCSAACRSSVPATGSSASSDRTDRARRRCCVLAGTLRPASGRRHCSTAVDLRACVARRRWPGGWRSCRRRRISRSTTPSLEVVLMGRYPHLGAFEIEGPGGLRDCARGAGGDRHAARSRIAPFATLSGGEKQRVIIAAALAQIAGAAELTASCCSTSRRRRSISAYQLELARAAASTAAATRADRDRRLDARPRTSPASALPDAGAAERRRGPRGRPDRRGADAGNIRALYGVDADVHAPCRHRAARRRPDAPRRPRTPPMTHGAARPATRGDAARLRRARWRPRSSSAPLVGSTPHQPARARSTRSIPFADNVDAQIFFVARLPRTLAGALRRRAARRRRASSSRAAAQSAGDAVHARRLGRRGARRDARDHLQLVARMAPGISAAPVASFAGSLAAVGDRLRAGARAASRPVDQRAAARRRDAERVLLGADPVRAVLRGLRARPTARCAG